MEIVTLRSKLLAFERTISASHTRAPVRPGRRIIPALGQAGQKAGYRTAIVKRLFSSFSASMIASASEPRKSR